MLPPRPITSLNSIRGNKKRNLVISKTRHVTASLHKKPENLLQKEILNESRGKSIVRIAVPFQYIKDEAINKHWEAG